MYLTANLMAFSGLVVTFQADTTTILRGRGFAEEILKGLPLCTYDVRKISGFFVPLLPLFTYRNQLILILSSAFWGPNPVRTSYMNVPFTKQLFHAFVPLCRKIE